MPMIDKADFGVLESFFTHNIYEPFNPKYLARFRRIFSVLLESYKKLSHENEALLKTNLQLEEELIKGQEVAE